ncbi:hypothetical protein L3X38_014571 [Prunus dulcis]|uniref:Uncharacterized protein n=1 Tax=Prunus dulcis TaxID=3755 RepID=A0AAD4WQK1_PRUDU|nr:hypothetical protein L3X38_014571 [Prunus dulcis]
MYKAIGNFLSNQTCLFNRCKMESQSASFGVLPSADSNSKSLLFSSGDFLEILIATLRLLFIAESVSGIPKNLFPLPKTGVLFASSVKSSSSVNNGTAEALGSSLTGTQIPSSESVNGFQKRKTRIGF